jgi:hypothetical protein
METFLGDCRTSFGSGMWAADRVHLSPEGYQDVATAILEVAQGGMDREDGDDDTWSEVLATKRLFSPSNFYSDFRNIVNRLTMLWPPKDAPWNRYHDSCRPRKGQCPSQGRQ